MMQPDDTIFDRLEVIPYKSLLGHVLLSRVDRPTSCKSLTIDNVEREVSPDCHGGSHISVLEGRGKSKTMLDFLSLWIHIEPYRRGAIDFRLR